jgi:outer membrane immunogenic protein
MLKSEALVTVSLLALTGTAAAEPVRPVVFPEWAGWYFGIQGGVAQNNSGFELLDPFSAGSDAKHTGGVLGGNVGYNWQGGAFVYGLETDINLVDAKASQSFVGLFRSSDIGWMGSFRGRFGVDYLSTLFYATGGLAYGGVKNSVSFTSTSPDLLVDDRTRVGLTVGGGIEHLFSDRFTARAEFRYTDFGSNTVSNKPFGSSGTTYRGRFSNQLLTGMLGLGYKF